MKRFLCIVGLFMIVQCVFANSIKEDLYKPKEDLYKPVEQEMFTNDDDAVQWWFERDYDREGHVIGKAIIVKNNTSNPVNVTFVISENGVRDTIEVYVPAGEKRRAWYGNSTLKVHGKPTYDDAF